MTTVIAFDLYGTLLSTSSISEQLAKLFGPEKAQTIATQARRYQLEYTWRSNSMNVYRSFSDLTRCSFRQAAVEAGVTLTPDQEDSIMQSYNGLDTFPEVDEAVQILSDSPSLKSFVFSNGTASMIKASLETSPSLAKASKVLPADNVISVESLQVYKPDPKTYRHLLESVGMQGHADQVWLVSSNPFDALGAVAAGLRAAWVDRAGTGWIDGLGGALGIEPTLVVQGVDEAVKRIAETGAKQ